MHHVEKRGVVLVDEHHHLAARLSVGGLYEARQPHVGVGGAGGQPVGFLVSAEHEVEHGLKRLPVHVLGHAHVEVEHGVFRPVLLEPLDGQPPEEVAPPGEVGVERAGEQRLAEAARAAQEQVLGHAVGHAVNVLCLVYVDVVLLAYLGERLYAYGVSPFLQFHG